MDDSKQLEIFAFQSNWLCSGSRIIITSRDEHLLGSNGVDRIYRSKELSYEEALELFSLKSFKKNHPPKDYMEVLNQFLELAAGLPLAIDVLGSIPYRRTVQEMELALQKFKLVPMDKIQVRLKISFDGLSNVEKEIFLHIACFFEGNDIDRVIEILDHLNLYMHFGLQVLIKKSLVKVSSSNQLCMHNLLQQMGREIVC